MRPSMYVSAQRQDGTRSVAEIREYVQHGYGKTIWEELTEAARANLQRPPFTLRSQLPNRPPGMAEQAAHDHQTYAATTKRVVYAAIAHLVTEDAVFIDDALRQLQSLMDDDEWPDWRHDVNARRGIEADHRVGGYVQNISIAYDWLHAFLTSEQRRWIRDGLVRKGIDRIFWSREKDSHWGNYNNWTGAIAAGAGIAGMSLRDEYERSGELVELSVPWMHRYLDTLGPEGEFNESPAYAASVTNALRFFSAYRSYTAEKRDVVGETRLAEFGRWYAYHVLPPARIVPFGDCEKTSPPNPLQFGVLAALTRDPVLQWFYLTYRDVGGYSDHPFELVAVDPSIEPRDPEGTWPHGRSYGGYGQDAISRTSWDPKAPECIVYGKGAHGWEDARRRGDRAYFHLDYDAGQVCIEGYGNRLIVDLYNSGGYVDRGLERKDYYGKGTFGHNVLMIGGRSTLDLGDPPPRITDGEFDDTRGGWWRCDLTGVYEGADRVMRIVVHLYPGIVAVLDEVRLTDGADDISLRWHTEDACTPDAGGRFTVASGSARCTGRVISPGGETVRYARGEHVYEPPYNVNYHNIEYEQHESYVEASVRGAEAALLSLFCVTPNDGTDRSWEGADGRWTVELPAGGTGEVRVDAEGMHVSNTGTGRCWSLTRDDRG